MQPRHYQIAARDAAYKFFRLNKEDRNPLIVLFTGLGKTIVMKMIAEDVVSKRHGRCLILAHRKELLAQTGEKIDGFVTIYSASLGQKNLKGDIVLGQIQSIHKKAKEVGDLDLVMVDEAHLVSPDEETMFASFLNELRNRNPKMRVLGLTATPYRMKEGSIVGPEGPFHEICYEYPIAQAIQEGFLTPLVTAQSPVHISHEGLHVRASEYVTSEVEERYEAIIAPACQDILARTTDRNHVLVFCASRKHARIVAETLDGRCVLGDMLASERDQNIADFKAGRFKFLVSVDALTTGFDAPMVDAIAMLRSTKSRGLFTQIAGRGVRLYPGKENCEFLDYGQNVKEFGPIDAPYEAPRKVWSKDSTDPAETMAKDWLCPECGYLNSTGFSKCDHCDYVRTRPIQHEVQAAHEAIMMSAGIQPKRRRWEEVEDERHYVHVPRDPEKPRSLLVEYRIANSMDRIREWICFEHEGYARKKAETWWGERSNDPVPATVDEAQFLADSGGLARTLRIRVDSTEKFPRVVGYDLGLVPPRIVAEGDDWSQQQYQMVDEEDAPF